MKKTLIAALAVGGLLALSPALLAADTNANPSNATSPANARGMRGPNIERLTEQLKLTDEQKPKVQAILDERMKQMGELRGQTDLSREDRMAKMRTIREDTDKKMKEVLTADQFDKYQQMNQNRGRRNNPPPAADNKPADAPAAPPQK